MAEYSAGRFKAHVFVGAANGKSTWLIELSRSGSGEEVGRLTVDFEDLPDLRHVLERAIRAHGGGT